MIPLAHPDREAHHRDRQPTPGSHATLQSTQNARLQDAIVRAALSSAICSVRKPVLSVVAEREMIIETDQTKTWIPWGGPGVHNMRAYYDTKLEAGCWRYRLIPRHIMHKEKRQGSRAPGGRSPCELFVFPTPTYATTAGHTINRVPRTRAIAFQSLSAYACNGRNLCYAWP